MFPMPEATPAPGRLTSVRPNGQRANRAILSAAMPNGIVMIRTKQISAANVYAIASQRPARTNQMMFSSRRMESPAYRPSRARIGDLDRAARDATRARGGR
jgi:hypothetical protein